MKYTIRYTEKHWFSIWADRVELKETGQTIFYKNDEIVAIISKDACINKE
jgi:hypothetical protein